MTYKNKTLTNVYTAYEEISSIIIMKVKKTVDLQGSLFLSTLVQMKKLLLQKIKNGCRSIFNKKEEFLQILLKVRHTRYRYGVIY